MEISTDYFQAPELDYDDNTTAPVIFAVHQQNLHKLENLLILGSDVNHKDEHEYTALHYAVINSEENSLEIVQLLLDSGANVNAINHDGMTPLHRAAMQTKYMEMIEQLVNRGALLDLQDCSGDTPLHIAARRTNLQAVKKLIELNADYSIKNKRGEPPLDLLSSENAAKIQYLLRRHG